MSHDIKTAEPKVKEGEGFLRRLLNRIDPSAGDAHSGSAGKGISCYRSGSQRRHGRCWADSSAVTLPWRSTCSTPTTK
jgi:hypothetical protein